MDRNSSSAKAFDFSTQSSIMAILAGIRKSELSVVVKNELRDLIFLYTSGGGDDSVRIALEQKLTNHNIVPVTPTKQNQSIAPEKQNIIRPTLSFGTFRPVPIFDVPAVSTKADISRPIVQVSAVKSAVKQFKLQTSKVTSDSVFIPKSQASVESKVNQVEAALIKPENKSEVKPVDEVKEIPKAQEVSKEKESTLVLDNSPELSVLAKKYLNRIREIKTTINSKVGNPVNLVDIDNQAGREYMNALLDAMKKLNSSSLSDLENAMQRLESAFLVVDKVITERSIVADSVKSQTIPTQVVKSETKKVEVPIEIKPEVKVETTTIIKNVEFEKTNVKPTQREEVSNFGMVEKTPVLPNIPAKAIPAMRTMNNQTPVVPNASPVSAPVSINKIPSLAEEKKVPSFADLPTTLPRKESEIGNPLYTAEIDAGLDELLSDWSLFKKSGLFGSGPKGKEHPLFQKIANVQVPLLLAGRFDGATQEVRQSITDYMNGWRYEQGIVYEPGETFETYLRRVIKHIIDLQK